MSLKNTQSEAAPIRLHYDRKVLLFMIPIIFDVYNNNRIVCNSHQYKTQLSRTS